MIIVNTLHSEAIKQFRTLARIVAKTHPGVMPDKARQILMAEAKELGIDPLHAKRILKLYNFAASKQDPDWVAVTPDPFPRWKLPIDEPEIGSCWMEPRTRMMFVWVPGGEFERGNLFEGGFNSERPVHEVELDGFWLGKYLVTQEQWYTVMKRKPPFVRQGARYPVERVSWHDAHAFIQAMDDVSAKARFRLPTEAEWEYAARSGGKKELYAGGNDANRLAWYADNSAATSHPVVKKRPNGLDLYDMTGNVLEWCQDWFDETYYTSERLVNPKGPEQGIYRVVRGGEWDSSLAYIRTSARNYWDPEDRDFHTGFRLVREYP